jgi:hypothetical protein
VFVERLFKMADYKDRIRVHIEGKEFSVVGGEFRDMLAAVKQINGRRFVGELKVWQLPGTVEDIQNQLEISGYYLEGGKPIADPATPAGPTSQPQSRDRIRIKLGGHRRLAVTGGSFQEMLAMIKSLPGRRFDGDAKIWEIPGDLGVIQGMIQAAGYKLEGAEKISQEPVPPMETLQFSDVSEPPPFEPPDFLGEDDVMPFEPPDWLDDDQMLPPPEPPDWWDDELEPPPADYGDPETAPFESEPSPFASAPPGPRSTPTPASKSGGDRIRIRVGGIPQVVTGGSFRDMLAAIKNIPGRRFNGQDKVWDIPDDLDLESVRQMINAAGFEMGRD